MYVSSVRRLRERVRRERKEGKWKQQHSVRLFTSTTTSLLVPPLLSFLAGEALFPRYGYADNICIIGARERTNDNLSLLLLCVFGWRAHTHGVYLFVSFSLSIAPHLSLSISPKKNSCIAYDYARRRCVHVYVGNPFFWLLFFLASFIFFFFLLLFNLSSFAIS